MRIETTVLAIMAGLILTAALLAGPGIEHWTLLLAAALLGAAGTLGAASVFAHLRIVVPLRLATTGLRRLVCGEHDLSWPTPRRDEIGDLWRTMEALSRTIRDAEGMRKTQSEDEERRHRRQEEIDQLIGFFAKSVGEVSSILSRASIGMAEASFAIARSSGDTEERMGEALTLGDETALNACRVASASEQLSATIGAVARQAEQAFGMSDTAMRRTLEAGASVERLCRTAEEIGAVLELITHLASQTNLLALHATVESVRAGEAGKGFAVVAQDVKRLAHQTVMATSDIGAKIEGIRSATVKVARAIGGVHETLQELRESGAIIATTLADQAAATEGMTGKLLQVSASAGEIADRMLCARQATQRGGATVGQVRQTADRMSSEASRIGEEVRVFLHAMTSFAANQDFVIHAVDLAAEVLAPAGAVHGRVKEISIGFALFSGSLAAEAGTPVELRVEGLKPIRSRVVGRADGPSVYLQFPLSHDHMAQMRTVLTRLSTEGGQAIPAAA